VFLDEIAELAAGTQAKLLRVFEERIVTRLGSNRPRPIDVRIVAATNRDVEADSGHGRFRQDLFFRLNGISLLIPPLRDRPLEIETFARTFLAAACREIERMEAPRLSTAALETLHRRLWPGNVRELRNAIDVRSFCASEGDPSGAPAAVASSGSGRAAQVDDGCGPDVRRVDGTRADKERLTQFTKRNQPVGEATDHGCARALRRKSNGRCVQARNLARDLDCPPERLRHSPPAQARRLCGRLTRSRARLSLSPPGRRHDRCLRQPSNLVGDPMRPTLFGTRYGDREPMNVGARIGAALQCLTGIVVSTGLTSCTGGGASSSEGSAARCWPVSRDSGRRCPSRKDRQDQRARLAMLDRRDRWGRWEIPAPRVVLALQGPRARPGRRGPQGVMGVMGTPGAAGATGPEGATGGRRRRFACSAYSSLIGNSLRVWRSGNRKRRRKERR
jgi:hypothetical protein